MAPVCDLLAALSRHEKSARLLPTTEVVTALRDVLVGYLGRWDVCSPALRAPPPSSPPDTGVQERSGAVTVYWQLVGCARRGMPGLRVCSVHPCSTTTPHPAGSLTCAALYTY